MDTKILYIQYTNPAAYPPLQHSSRILAQAGWQVLLLGIHVSGIEALSFTKQKNITLRNLPFCSPGWQQKLHYLWFCLWVISWTIRWKPQWIYASDLLSCPITFLLSALLRIKVVYHEHDSPTASAANSTFIRLCLIARKWLAQRAKICILPNQQRLERFAQDTNIENIKKNLLCVWNCPAQEEVSLPRSPHNNNNNDLWIWYHGSIVPPQLPPTVLSALAILPKNVKLRVAGYETAGHIGYIQQLREMAQELGIKERIEFLGAVPTRTQLLERCQKCDIGIALFPQTSLQHMSGASNKPFDYLACGLALLVSDLPDWKQMYVEPGCGLSCNPDQPESIATAINKFLENSDKMRQMGEIGRKQILQHWNYEQQFMEVYKKLCLS